MSFISAVIYVIGKYLKLQVSRKLFYELGFFSQRWLDINLSTLGGVISFFAAVFAILARDSLSPAAAGLSISFSLTVKKLLGKFSKNCSWPKIFTF
jgi:hypothetical protein